MNLENDPDGHAEHHASAVNMNLPINQTNPPSTSSSPTPRRASHHVSDDTWAKAVHAVKVQKLSLRQAAHMYGVHHMSLHRRVRGCYSTPQATMSAAGNAPTYDVRMFFTADNEAEALGMLREQFLHERRITADDIRFVVRAIASQGGRHSLPPDFPTAAWIHEFKTAHGFAKLNHFAYPPCLDGDDEDMEDVENARYSSTGFSVEEGQPTQQHQQTSANGAASMPPRHPSISQSHTTNTTTSTSTSDPPSDGDRDEATSNASATSSATSHDTGGTRSSVMSSSQHSSENGDASASASSAGDKRTYQLSHTVTAETWAKAIAAVEQQGLSLRVAAKLHGVHFAALHRRVKKRAQGEHGAGADEYFTPEQEAGVIRVAVARAELGVPMTFDELMDLVQRVALRNLPDLSVNAARKLMGRFQSRNEHSIRQIITNWPLRRSIARQGAPVIRVVNTPPSMPARISPPNAYERSQSFPLLPSSMGGFPMSDESNIRLSGSSLSSSESFFSPRDSSSLQLQVGSSSPHPPPPPRNGNDADSQSRTPSSRSSSSSRPIMFV